MTSTSELQPITPVPLTELSPGSPRTGEPIFERVDPGTLYVDHTYQRYVGERGYTQIRRIIAGFCWTKFKPPICAYAEHDGRTILKVLDGQHTAIAAASHPHIDMIPVMIVDAPDTPAQAAAFVGQNTERLGVTPLQIHLASVVAGDEAALDIEKICERAGVRVLRTTPGNSRYRGGDTIAIAAIRGLIARQTAPTARRILEVLAQASLAPITGLHIKAAEHVMVHPDFANKFDSEELIKTIGALYLTAEEEAKLNAKSLRIPEWRALAMIWARKTKKRRVVLSIAA